MHIRHHLIRLFGFLFALYVMYFVSTLSTRVLINYAYLDPKPPPNLQAIHNIDLQKRVFIEYLTPIVRNENHFLRKVHNRILSLHRQFLRYHRLSPDQLYVLNFYYIHTLPFSIYQKATWSHLLSQTDTVSAKPILDYTKRHFENKLYKFIMEKYHNPFLLPTPPTHCPDPAYMLLGQNKPWTQLLECYRPYRLSLAMPHETRYRYINYTSLEAAIEDYLWTVNTNPVYAAYRQVRTSAHVVHHSLDSTTIGPLLDPHRLYDKKYYMMQP